MEIKIESIEPQPIVGIRESVTMAVWWPSAGSFSELALMHRFTCPAGPRAGFWG